MKLSEDDKEFLAAIFGMWLIIAAAIFSINAAPRAHNHPKSYQKSCVINYIKYPLEECTYKEKHD